MSTLYGYVRGIDIDENTCSMVKPNLYYKRLGEFLEVRVEIDDICEDLIDYLESQSRPMNEREVANVVLDSVISTHELNNLYDEMVENNYLENLKFRHQLNLLIVQCETIAMLGGVETNNLFLEFTIS